MGRLLPAYFFAVAGLFLNVLAEQGWAQAPAGTEFDWHDVASLSVEGQGWDNVESRYDRFPAKAKASVRPAVWSLSQHSSGLCVTFKTDATRLQARWSLRNPRVAMSHMPATGVSGLDLYVQVDGAWKFLAVARPEEKEVKGITKDLVSGLAPGEKTFRIYLPLYNGIEKLEIGLPAGSTFTPMEKRTPQQTVVFYGTSITQGGCASRPGLSYSSILGRRLDLAAINLGFSGNGRAEPEVASLLAELNPAVYVIDCLPNLDAAGAKANLPGFLATLRKAHPETPIVLVEHLDYTNGPFVASRNQKVVDCNRVLKELYEDLLAKGDQKLFYLPGKDLIGQDGEGTVDTTHPNDAGFLRMADAMEPVIRKALQR